MKIKIEIKQWITGAVLFEFEKENNTIRDTVLEAIKRSANLSFANLSSANLRSADLSFANLSFANLRSADLRSANLRFANLSFANLSFANLRSADLSFANLRFANLSSANLSSAKNLPDYCIDAWWHIHHEVLWEVLTERIANRINYIKENKPKEEVETRLRLLKPVLGKIPTTPKGWEELHKKECKKCPWNGKTIFPTK